MTVVGCSVAASHSPAVPLVLHVLQRTGPCMACRTKQYRFLAQTMAAINWCAAAWPWLRTGAVQSFKEQTVGTMQSDPATSISCCQADAAWECLGGHTRLVFCWGSFPVVSNRQIWQQACPGTNRACLCRQRTCPSTLCFDARKSVMMVGVNGINTAMPADRAVCCKRLHRRN